MRLGDDMAVAVDEPMPYVVIANFGHAVVKVIASKIDTGLYDHLRAALVVHESDIATGFNAGQAFTEIPWEDIMVDERDSNLAVSIDVSERVLVIGDGGEADPGTQTGRSIASDTRRNIGRLLGGRRAAAVARSATRRAA
jgi:hypothetical protein